MGNKYVKAMLAGYALAVAYSASAQSSVTLYGAVDSSIYYQNKTPKNQGKTFQLLDGGMESSHFGMIGTEDLGGGYRAGFKIESGFLTTNGALGNSNGGLFGRNAYVSLDGPFGSVKAGLQFSPFFLAVYDTDPSGFSDQASALIPYLNNFLIAGLFSNNTVSYTTPVFGGFSGAAMFGFGGVAGNFKAGKQQSFSAKYSDHGILAEVAYFSANDATGGTAQQGRLAGLTYKWGELTVGGAFVNYKTPGSTTGVKNVNVYSASGHYWVTPALGVFGGVYVSRDQNSSANRSELYGLGTEYLLSKRTDLYAQVGVVHNKGIMGTGLNSQSMNSLEGLPAGTTVGVNVGITHRF
ncbi:porin [Trinickia symbiotica]|uniref:Porin n=1 Tax=Trinickia symbiotica TaxID=863227 RepID=A0A2N7WLF1_9BURK|nr:porin [Trinickia symbiotica]PMS30115.1 porin [Trinickia symbiotica]